MGWLALDSFCHGSIQGQSIFFSVYFPLFRKSKHLYIKKSVVKVVKSNRLISRGVQIHLRRNRSTVTRNGETAEYTLQTTKTRIIKLLKSWTHKNPERQLKKAGKHKFMAKRTIFRHKLSKTKSFRTFRHFQSFDWKAYATPFGEKSKMAAIRKWNL